MLGLPETSEGTSRGDASWRVREKAFVWERPLRKTDQREVVVEAWLAKAPKRLAREYSDAHL